MTEEYDPLTDYLRIRLRMASADFITISEPMREVCAEAADALQAKDAEIAALNAYKVRRDESGRLKDCLKKANDRAEHFEREWYLRGDENESLRAWKASRLLHEGCNGHMRGDPPAYVPECVSLRADAERYRLLRDLNPTHILVEMLCVPYIGINSKEQAQEALDSAIDAAMGTTRNVTPTEDAILRRAAVRGATVVSKGRLSPKGTT